MAKEVIEHKDILGNPILETSKLAVAHRNDLMICTVVKIHNKMLRVRPLGTRSYSPDNGILVYPLQSVVVDGPDAMAYVLRYG